MLIDSGHYRDDGEYVVKYLQARGIDRIDHLVTSHGDADHIGGHADVISYFETQADGIGAVYDPGITSSTQTYSAYLDAIEQHNVTLYEVRAGDTIPFNGTTASVLAPPESYLASDDRNENSIVLKITHGEFGFLTTGDAEDDGEAYLVSEHRAQLNSSLLKAGHHGSSSSTGSELLDAASPQVAVISSAYDSQYGHPHDEVLQRLTERNIDTYWTATHGNIILTSDGDQLTVATQASAPTNALELRQADPIEPGSDKPISQRRTYQLSGSGSTSETSTTNPTTTQSQVRSLALANVHADAEGRDGDNLNDEYIILSNTGDSTLDLSGWTIADSAGHTYQVPAGVTLESEETLTIRTGSGSDTDSELYWGASSPIWNNDGDTVIVTTDDGDTILEETYS